MKRFCIFAPLLLIACAAQAQTWPSFSTTVGSLPSATTYDGWVFEVTDGAAENDCTTGGGSTEAVCRAVGGSWTAWVPGTSATSLTSGTIPAARVGSDHIDAIAEIAAALKSGADATLITGTAGTSGNCAEWNADGDLVGSGAACGGGGGSGTMTTVKEGGVQVGGADIVTLDLGAGFDITESPDTEINIVLDYTEDPVNLSGSEVTGVAADARIDGSAERDEVCSTTDLSAGCEINADVVDFADVLYTNTLAASPALGADECYFVSTAAGGGLICEGSAANTNEQLFLVPDIDEADATYRLVADNTEVTSVDGTGLTISAGTLSADLGTSVDLTSEVTGTLPVASGGTGATTLTDGGILLGSGTGAITALGVASNGQIPIGDGTTDPVLATITGTAGEIAVTNGAGSITLDLPATITPNLIFSGNLTLQGANDAGNAESVKLPNSNTPAVNAEGQFAHDNDADCWVSFDGSDTWNMCANAQVTTDATTARTLTDSDQGAILNMTNAGAITITVNTGLGIGDGRMDFTVILNSAGSIAFAGTATVSGDVPANQGDVAYCIELAADTYNCALLKATFKIGDIDAFTSSAFFGQVSDETGSGAIVGGTSPTIATPVLTGKIDRNNVSVDDDDCTGEQGLSWYDTTDSQFEFCNANSGTPTTLGGGTNSYQETLTGGTSTIGSNQTLYMGKGDLNSNENRMDFVMVQSATLSRLYVNCLDPPTSGDSYTIDVRVNGVDTALDCPINDPATTCNETSDTASVSAGDMVSLQIVSSATAATTRCDASFLVTF